jgi:hypothetical protein
MQMSVTCGVFHDFLHVPMVPPYTKPRDYITEILLNMAFNNLPITPSVADTKTEWLSIESYSVGRQNKSRRFHNLRDSVFIILHDVGVYLKQNFRVTLTMLYDIQ